MVNCPFSILYHVLAQAFGHCYRRCLKLENGNSYGVILGGKILIIMAGNDGIVGMKKRRIEKSGLAHFLMKFLWLVKT